MIFMIILFVLCLNISNDEDIITIQNKGEKNNFWNWIYQIKVYWRVFLGETCHTPELLPAISSWSHFQLRDDVVPRIKSPILKACTQSVKYKYLWNLSLTINIFLEIANLTKNFEVLGLYFYDLYTH